MAEESELEVLKSMKDYLKDIRDDLRWLKQREVNKMEAISKMGSSLRNAFPK